MAKQFNVDYNDDKHEYRIDGVIVKSVTQVLKDVGIVDYSWAEQEDLDFGTAMHDTIEYYEKGTLDLETLHPLLEDRLEAYKEFVKVTGWEAIFIESLVASKKLGCAGRFDQAGVFTKLQPKYNDKLTLLEIKSGALKTCGADVQSGGYTTMANEMGCFGEKISLRCGLHLGKDRKPKYEIYTNKDDITAFKNALWLSHYKQRRK